MRLEISGGSFAYGEHRVLDKINLTVGDGDVFAVLGRNGAGKTTLLKCIMRMLSWTEGTAVLDGEDMRDIPAARLWRSIAYVPQAKSGSSHTVRDMIVLGRSAHLRLFEKPSEKDYAIADGIMDRLYIRALSDKSCACLSGGELQLVLIGRALAAEPKLLIMDEPESNLDYHNQLHVLGIIEEISRTASCILNTHYPEHALRYASRALLLDREGRGVAGTAAEVVTEENLRRAFGIEVHIGQQEIEGKKYSYIVPLHH